ncbi:MAG TPA: L,D-transpeptidase [Rhizomicrobium sp.]|jgi:lipoprotein-anchoring transpeptidase ErfK/SrfK|nr:L,D-transpeptidase [Rhizomicrobium sp.]
MVRLRELAGAAAFGIVATSVAALWPTVSDVHVTFKPDYIKLASLGDAVFGEKAQVVAQTAPMDPMAGPGPVADAQGRLRAKIPNPLYQYFDVYLYVSKAASGSLAQHLYMFHKDASDNLVFEQSFPVSTGRERHEKYYTDTPEGLFQLDPDRFERMHYSHTWGGAAMPWAMFLNATIHGRQTGVALHSATVHTAELGSRASGGCVRLPPEKARELFERFHAEEQGMVPVFAYDAARRRTNGDGLTLRSIDGRPVLVPGYKVLVFIEDYQGGPALVAVVA